HHIFEMAVLRTILDHPYLAVAFDDLRFDLTDLFINKCRNVALARKYLFAGLDNAVRTQRIRLTRKTKRRLCFLPRFQKRLVRPLRNKRFIRLELIDRLDSFERAAGDIRQSLFKMLDWSHNYSVFSSK